MSHYHLEIIMPPAKNIEKVIGEILSPFSENCEDEEEKNHPFWDFYVIGGRFAGNKMMAQFEKKQLEKFHQELNDKKVTVSGLQCGKQRLSPESQIPMVDELWRKYFPNGGNVCPIFEHYNDQYKHSNGWPDIMKMSEIPKELIASHVIIAGPGYQKGTIKAEFMIQESMWNGVSFIDCKWDCKISTALKMFDKKLTRYSDEAQEKYKVKSDWLCVTIDYHS